MSASWLSVWKRNFTTRRRLGGREHENQAPALLNWVKSKSGNFDIILLSCIHSCRPTYLFKFWFPILISIQFKLSYACKLIKCNFKIYISKGSLDKNGGIPSNLVNNNCSTDWFYSEKWYVIWFFKGPFLRKLLSVNNSADFFVFINKDLLGFPKY